MPDTQNIWQSIHTNYIEFALDSLGRAQPHEAGAMNPIHFDRATIEAIRYSYDALEASLEFTYSMGITEQFRDPAPDTWLSHHLTRRWKDSSTADRLGLIAYAWRATPFWGSPKQFQLFRDLKKLRDGLTHPIPYGAKVTGKTEELLKPGWLVYPDDGVADFAPIPNGLGAEDADRAVEIMLRHLIRLEDLFFGGPDTWFAVYDREAKGIVSTRDLLDRTGRSFEDIWNTT